MGTFFSIRAQMRCKFEEKVDYCPRIIVGPDRVGNQSYKILERGKASATLPIFAFDTVCEALL